MNLVCEKTVVPFTSRVAHLYSRVCPFATSLKYVVDLDCKGTAVPYPSSVEH